jgi:hypothetical protein
MLSSSPPHPLTEKTGCHDRLSVLVEADILGLLTEALTAQVEVVLSDETSLVLADAAAARALAVVSGAGVPDAFVRHRCGDD